MSVYELVVFLEDHFVTVVDYTHTSITVVDEFYAADGNLKQITTKLVPNLSTIKQWLGY